MVKLPAGAREAIIELLDEAVDELYAAKERFLVAADQERVNRKALAQQLHGLYAELTGSNLTVDLRTFEAEEKSMSRTGA